MPNDQNNPPVAGSVTPSEEQRRNAVDFAVRSLSGSDDVGELRTTTMMTRAKRLALFLAGNLDA